MINMKKIFTLFAAMLLSLSAMAQYDNAVTLVGEATFGGTFMGVEVSQTNPSDTIIVQTKDGDVADITLPALTFTQMGMTIPSFTIHNATYAYDAEAFGAVFTEEQAINETVATDKGDKAFVGKINYGKILFAETSFDFSATYKYGVMPGEITYTIKAKFFDPEGIQDIQTDRNTANCYDLSGRRVIAPVKGQMYITNGRKFIAK